MKSQSPISGETTSAEAAGTVSPRRALVLSGGGARGAYEAGVLRYLFEKFPDRLGRLPRIDLFCGTSVGAIHACYMASAIDQGKRSGQQLAEIWGRLRLSDMASLHSVEVLRIPWRLLGFARTAVNLASSERPDRLHGLLNTRALEDLVLREIRWPAIGANLKARRFDALCISATQLASGRVVVFVENRERSAPPWTRDLRVIARPTRIRPVHALASAAIPVLFPAVLVEDSYYVDGGLRLNTPLAPALRLGADRVLVIALRKGVENHDAAQLEHVHAKVHANPVFLYGKVLNALLLDHVETDLAHMRVINALLESGEQSYGPDFLTRINTAVTAERGQGFRHIRELVIRPSEDLAVIADRALRTGAGAGDLPRWMRLFLRSIGLRGGPLEADLLSYLLFDRAYTSELVALGYRDAQRCEDELLTFFSD